LVREKVGLCAKFFVYFLRFFGLRHRGKGFVEEKMLDIGTKQPWILCDECPYFCVGVSVIANLYVKELEM
jgi:hypothetical protein